MDAPSVLGLSYGHISPSPDAGTVSTETPAALWPAPEPYSVDVASGGTFVALHARGHASRAPGATRGVVCGFSRKSRKRLLDKLNCVPVDVFSDALFVTLTFPDVFPCAARAKRCLDTFLKRLRRRYPRCSGVWRMERVRRCSGVNSGELAPHFHVLLFGMSWLPSPWLARAWYECVGSGDERHLKAGTSVQRVRSRRAAMSYASKYLAKVETETATNGEQTGRVWSVFGVAWLGVAVRSFALSKSQFYQLRRVLRKYVLRSWRGGGSIRSRFARSPDVGVTAYLSESTALRLLSWLAETEPVT